jgi:hypothetical protein
LSDASYEDKPIYTKIPNCPRVFLIQSAISKGTSIETGLHKLARGIDHSKVVPQRAHEIRFRGGRLNTTSFLAETDLTIRRLAKKGWAASRNESRIARTVVLKAEDR